MWWTIISYPMWRTIISRLMWRTIISRPMSGHPRRSWNSGFDFHAVDSAFQLLDSGFLSVSLVEFPNSTGQDSGFHQQIFPRFQNPVIPYILWRIQGRGALAPPLIFRQNWGPKGGKNWILESGPPFLRVWMTGTPLPLYLKVLIRHWYGVTYQRAQCGLIWFIGNWPEPLFTFSLLTRVMFVNMLIFIISVSTLN